MPIGKSPSSYVPLCTTLAAAAVLTFGREAAQQLMGIKERIPKGLADWYDGPSLLEYLDGMQALDRKVNAPFMMAINGKYRGMPRTPLIFQREDGVLTFETKRDGHHGRGSGVCKKGMTLIMVSRLPAPFRLALGGERLTQDAADAEQAAGRHSGAVTERPRTKSPLRSAATRVRLRLRGIEEEEIIPGFVLCSPEAAGAQRFGLRGADPHPRPQEHPHGRL